MSQNFGKNVRSFLLVPDSSAARRIRRVLAVEKTRVGVVVGTWLELVEVASDAYFTPKKTENWNSYFNSALALKSDRFWSESYAVSPQETADVIERALFQVVSASDPFIGFSKIDLNSLPERCRRHLGDLIDLAESLNGQLPGELPVVQSILNAFGTPPIQKIHVSHIEKLPELTRWQIALVERLNADAGIDIDQPLCELMSRTLTDAVSVVSTKCLSALQSGLFLPRIGTVELDDSLQWVGVRDYLEEAELAAGMCQMLLSKHVDFSPSDIGLLIPDSFEYSLAIEDAFRLAGLPLSGLSAERWRRDLGGEAVFHFLYCLQKPAPAMALAACLSSPLMPWSRADGGVLAQKVMDGDYRLRPLYSANDASKAMLKLIGEGEDSPQAVRRAVKSFAELLVEEDGAPGHLIRAKTAAAKVCQLLNDTKVIEWTKLRRAISPEYVTAGESPEFSLEGITVWRESHEAWRRVRHLIVLGFAQGRYPSLSKASSVFSADDLNAISERCDLLLEMPASKNEYRRRLFKRQLSAVTDSVTFMVPRRDPMGNPQAPSESLSFMHQLFEGVGEVESLILELGVGTDREKIQYLARTDSDEPQPARALVADDINFEQNLLALRQDDDGNQKPESPSSIETLMVSRLAWLLRRVGAEPLAWAPESPDVMLLGTLAHRVFEGIFPIGKELPNKDQIPSVVNTILTQAIKQIAPFLGASQWQVERRHLAAGISLAAQAWSDILQTLGAEIIGAEEWLHGQFSGIPIHGQVDALLGLPDERMLVVDYKRSSSSSRLPRMEKGYDSQATLYRTMLKTGGPKDQSNQELIRRIKSSIQVGIVYYMLNDQKALSDSMLMESGGIPGWESFENDVSAGAVELIKRCLRELQDGWIRLNRQGDAVYFEKQLGVKPYALENSPLISLFTISGEAEEAE